jgi:hypothetical protein
MPPRYAYWTILIDDKPTAFRARESAELLPTLRQLQRTNRNVVMKWFARGRLWESPDAERAAQRAPKPPVERRGNEWRPGGQHKDPRARFKKGGRPPRQGQESRGPGKDRPVWRDKAAPPNARPAGHDSSKERPGHRERDTSRPAWRTGDHERPPRRDGDSKRPTWRGEKRGDNTKDRGGAPNRDSKEGAWRAGNKDRPPRSAGAKQPQGWRNAGGQNRPAPPSPDKKADARPKPWRSSAEPAGRTGDKARRPWRPGPPRPPDIGPDGKPAVRRRKDDDEPPDRN